MDEYLHYAEEEVSELTKSFWFGKFLQTLPDDVLLSCRKQELRVRQQEHQPSQATTPQDTAETRSKHAHDYKTVIFEPLGRSELPLWLYVQRADKCLQSCESSLSPLVHKLVVEPIQNTTITDTCAVMLPPASSVLRLDLTLEWSEVATFLGSDVVHEKEDYGKGAVKCADLAKHICSVLSSLPCTHWDGLFLWTGNNQLFAECVELLHSAAEGHEHTHLSLLLCCTALERALGDVYLSISRASHCPSLLRDLLTTQELERVFGLTAMCCLHCLIGPPSGLNLRNVLWHGFPSPGEICPDYGYLLLAITATLGRALSSSPVIEIVHRPPVTFHQESVIADTFPDLCETDLQWVEQLFSASFFILPSMLPLWLAGFSAFKEGRYHHSLVLLLPGLEHSLRRVFACINHCPQRALTAESTVLYTTFDEILSPVLLPDFSQNALQSEIGSAKLECLLDILVHPEGPRLRDRLSHGEVDFYSLSKCLVSHLVSVSVLFCAQYCLDPSLTTKPVIEKCLAVEKSYTSLFHPLSLLKRELLGLTEQLESWSGIPILASHEDSPQGPASHEDWPQGPASHEDWPQGPASHEDWPQGPASHEDWPQGPASHEDWLQGPAQVVSRLESEPVAASVSSLSPSHSLAKFSAAVERLVMPHYSDSAHLHSIQHQVTRLHYDAAMAESGDFSTALSGLVVQVWTEGVSTLHCSRAQLELAGLMRQTTENTAKTLTQIRDTAVLRYGQYQQKQLRSRQRKNYEHLVARGVVCLLVVILVTTTSRLQPLTKTEAAAKKAIKFHKKVLQTSENLFSLTSSSKNRWEEADALALTLTGLDTDILA